MSALLGTVVVELGQIYNGPYAGYLLASGGATVYKIEPPRGDYLRARDGEVGLHFALLNAGKRSAVLNLKHPRGCELLREMVRRADVVIENYAPGTMERLGLAPESLRDENPRLIYATSSGYGRFGQRRSMPAMDMAIQAASGVMSATGFPDRPPVRSAASVADFFSGAHLYGAIVTALLERERTGNGQIVEVAMLDAMLPAQATLFAAYFATGATPSPNGNRHAAIAPYDVYPARDGWIAILCGVDEHWHRLAGAVGQPSLADDPRFMTDELRVANNDILDTIIASWTSEHSKSDIESALAARDVPCAVVRTISDVVMDDELFLRGALRWVHHDRLGRLAVAASPMRFAEPPAELDPAPALGEGNLEVYGNWLGLHSGEIDRLEGDGVIAPMRVGDRFSSRDCQ